MTTATIGLAPFRYSYVSDTWWWSDETYRLFGFAPGEVVPSTDLILRHQHPDDVESALHLVREQLAERRQFCIWHRILNARLRARQLLTHGEGVFDEATGECREIRGTSFDVTHALRLAYARDVDEAVRAAAGTRDVIEQAKGVLMLSQRLGPEDAFQVLRRCSQATNVKVRDLAGDVVAEAAQTGELPAPVRSQLADRVGRVQRIPASLADGAARESVEADGALRPEPDGSADPVD